MDDYLFNADLAVNYPDLFDASRKNHTIGELSEPVIETKTVNCPVALMDYDEKPAPEGRNYLCGRCGEELPRSQATFIWHEPMCPNCAEELDKLYGFIN